jgi:hypothetical protein
VAFLFARKANDSLASLVKKLEDITAANEDMHTVVNFIGLEQGEVAKFGKTHGIKHAALTITDEKNAQRFKVAPEAELTVMHYGNKKVAANHAVAPGELDEAKIKAIVNSTKTILPAKK